MLEAAGFVGVEFSPHRYDTFSDAPSASSAAAFGTQGVDVRAVQPGEGVVERRPIGEGLRPPHPTDGRATGEP